MEPALIKFLTECNLLETLQNIFLDECMTLDLLFSASENDIKDLIPKIGHRILIKRKIKQMKMQSSEPPQKKKKTSICRKKMKTVEKIQERLIPIKVEPCDKDISNLFPNESTMKGTSENTIDHLLSSCSGQFISNPTLMLDDNTVFVKVKTLQSENLEDTICEPERPHVNDKRMKQNQGKESTLFEGYNTFEEFLCSENLGRNLKAIYANNETLDSNSRTELVHLVIDGLLDTHSSVPPELFSTAAHAICKVFPTECLSTYFNETFIGERKVTTGKLISRYRNQKHFLGKRENIKDYKKISKEEVSENSDIEGKVFCLQTSCEPWEEVVKYWDITRDCRQKQNKVLVNPYDVIDQFQCLKHPLGYTLIEKDFNALYPGKEVIMFSRYKTVMKVLLKLCNDFSGIPMLKSWEGYATDEDRDIAIFGALPFIFTAEVYKRGGKSWKATASERCKAFLFTAYSMADVEKEMKNRKWKYDELLINFPPSMFILKEKTSTKFFLILGNSIKYESPSFLKCVDTTFKIMNGLNLKYGVETCSVWTFIQTYFYDINTKHDRITHNVRAFTDELKKIIKNTKLKQEKLFMNCTL